MTHSLFARYGLDPKTGRMTFEGDLDIGKPYIPPKAHGVAMEDRVTGVDYWITDDTTTGVVDTPLPGDWNTNIYGPLDGPQITTLGSVVRLYVSSGSLLYEEVTEIRDRVQSANVITVRKGTTREAWQATSVTALKSGTIVWTKVLTNGVAV